jgi:hypothetical protein
MAAQYVDVLQIPAFLVPPNFSRGCSGEYREIN